MAFDNYVVGALSRELNSLLLGGRVERVYQPEREEIVLCVHRPPRDGRPPGRYNLLISASASRPLVYLAERREAGPGNPPAFCMLLRKYLVGAWIDRIEQVPRERILHIDFMTSSELGLRERRTLVFELMGKHSNIIFLDGTRIVDAIKRVTGDMSRVRQTLPGMEYMPPPPGKGISPIMEEETKNADLTGKGIGYFDGLAAEGAYSPAIFSKEGKTVDFHVFRLCVYDGFEAQGFCGESAVSDMLEAWYESREAQGRVPMKANEIRSGLKARLDKLYLKKQRLSEELAEAARAETLRETGDLVTANIWRIEKGAARVALEDYTKDGAVRTIDLDPRLTPAGNAQRYYKLYGKAKTAAVVKAKQLEETGAAIGYIEGAMYFVDEAGSLEELEALRAELSTAGYIRLRKGGQRKGAPSGNKRGGKRMHGGVFAPHEYALPSGARVLVGRNNAENDELTMRMAAKTDIWLHTKDIPGSHAIYKPADGSAGATAPADGGADLRMAAEIAAWHSKGRGSEGVPVDYTLVRNVKKPSGARPGYVIFTNNKTLYVTPKLPE
ncbi:MAG: NFACT family protein [Clostridiales bacterium]|nr:NFACT family protein [Clostridiales bacterium]